MPFAKDSGEWLVGFSFNQAKRVLLLSILELSNS